MNISTKDRIVRTIASPGCKRGTVVYGAINTEINSPNWRRRPAENDEGIRPHISRIKPVPFNPSSTHSCSPHFPSSLKTPLTLSCPLSTKAYCQISHTPSPNSPAAAPGQLLHSHLLIIRWSLYKHSSPKLPILPIHFAV